MDFNGSGRRRFLKSAAALAGVGAGLGAEWAANGQAAKPGAAKPDAPGNEAFDRRELSRRGARFRVDLIAPPAWRRLHRSTRLCGLPV